MSWKNVQYQNGKYRTSEGGGGGGSSTFGGLDDVSFSDLQNGQVPKYNSTTQQWENANESGGGGTVTDVEVDGVSVVNQQGVAEIPAIPDGLHHYSTTEQVVGTWTNGKPIYSKTIKTENLILSGWQYINHGISNIEEVIKAFGSLKRVSDGHFCCIPCCRPVTADGIMIVISATQIEYINTWIATDDNTDVSFTLLYTKTTD